MNPIYIRSTCILEYKYIIINVLIYLHYAYYVVRIFKALDVRFVAITINLNLYVQDVY